MQGKEIWYIDEKAYTESGLWLKLKREGEEDVHWLEEGTAAKLSQL